jgi:hypothetical protein
VRESRIIVDQDVIKFLDGYVTNDWELLQKEIKQIYWQKHRQRDSMASLISNASKMELNVYIVKYSSICGTCVERGALSILDRVNWFLDGLSEELCDRALEYCSKIWDGDWAALNILISNAKAGKMDLDVFIVNFPSMPGTLVARGVLSILDRVSWFLDGLPEQLCDRALEYCSKKDWRLSANDTGSEPWFNDLKEFVLSKARAAWWSKSMIERENGQRDGVVVADVSSRSEWQFYS